ncbi:hypothetical protein EK21DRAFT_86706 [Setomelanomma holmii]|uniref:Uncharacterized protein n=1 Tax=Setomelanomma holmii TaxID=210430 RepID=A0A9P4HH72_9PLEO|nr:hypothetical protein EK21DRAFT_86706 [Setomelanomma holmii]
MAPPFLSRPRASLKISLCRFASALPSHANRNNNFNYFFEQLNTTQNGSCLACPHCEVNVESSRPIGAFLLDDFTTGDPQEELPEGINVEDHALDEEFQHGFAGCTSLLGTCRQIYHEAATVLYGTNEHLFSHVLDQEYRGCYDQTNAALNRLRSIGSQSSMISTVVIDADARCPETCHLALPNCSLNALQYFASYGQIIYAEHGPASESIAASTRPSDARSPRFDILDEGKIVAFKPPPHSMVDKLPREVHEAVLDHACNSGSSVTFELDNKVANGLWLNFLAKDRWSCDAAIVRHDRKPQLTKYSLKMAAYTSKTNFDCFRSLDAWAENESFRKLVLPGNNALRHLPTIVLEFNLDRFIPFSDMRIEISCMLHVFEAIQDDAQLVFRQSDSAHAEGEYKSRGTCEKTTDWGGFERSTFILLSTVILKDPTLAASPLPSLWINGHGQLFHAVCPSSNETTPSSTIVYTHAALEEQEVKEEGARLAREIRTNTSVTSSLPGHLQGGSWFSLQAPPSRAASDRPAVVWASFRNKHWRN